MKATLVAVSRRFDPSCAHSGTHRQGLSDRYAELIACSIRVTSPCPIFSQFVDAPDIARLIKNPEELAFVDSGSKTGPLAVRFSPTLHLFQDWPQSPPFSREKVLKARRVSRIQPALHNATRFQFLESHGEHTRGKSRKRLLEILKATVPVHEELPEEQDAPAVTDNIESFCYRTVEVVFSRH